MVKRGISLTLACCLLLTLLPLSAPLAAEAMWEKGTVIETELLEEREISLQSRPLQGRIGEIFPDANLAQVIANVFGVPVNSVVLESDLARILAFNAEGRGIRSLAGMQHLTALREVNLNNNQIQSLAPLSGLSSLERLLLDDNQVRDLQPLRGLGRLRWLWLDRNRIADIRPLANLTNLEWLTLWDNGVEDISPLSRLTNLEALWLGDNHIRNIRPLERLTELETLMLVRNQIGDLRPLYGLAQMDTLWIGRQDITLPQVMRRNPFEKENVLRAPNGTSVRPIDISGNGSYYTPHLRWTGVTEEVYEVSYTFDYTVTVGAAEERFYGTVTQRLSATPFQDVQRGNWFYGAVAFVFEQNLMSGTSGVRFAPNLALNRAMFVTILWRMAEQPKADAPPIFSDVPQDAWFADAVAWASEQGIAQGNGRPDIFAPMTAVTREQFALMLYRFAEDKSVPANFTLDSYADCAEISDWAKDAMRWAVYHGFITGTKTNTLQPGHPASRAEGATILMRYLQS